MTVGGLYTSKDFYTAFRRRGRQFFSSSTTSLLVCASQENCEKNTNNSATSWKNSLKTRRQCSVALKTFCLVKTGDFSKTPKLKVTQKRNEKLPGFYCLPPLAEAVNKRAVLLFFFLRRFQSRVSNVNIGRQYDLKTFFPCMQPSRSLGSFTDDVLQTKWL